RDDRGRLALGPVRAHGPRYEGRVRGPHAPREAAQDERERRHGLRRLKKRDHEGSKAWKAWLSPLSGAARPPVVEAASPNMTITDDDARRIRPYVSNLDGDVFALAGLPEEVIAVLFAYYSRSKDDLRTNLARLLADQDIEVGAGGGQAPQFRLATEKARAFH